jgi:hypothetical protein
MTLLTELAAVLANSNNALAGVFLRNHAKEIIALVEAAEFTVLTGEGLTELDNALAALNKEKNT